MTEDTIEQNILAFADEALALTTGADYWTTPAAPGLGIRSVRLADGPHGLRVQNDENPDHLGLERSHPATCFPPAVTLASSWDVDLIERVGQALAVEARAAGVDVVLGPGLNIKRSPLCGRNFEYYSEDPLLAGMLAGAIARGLQSQGVAACLKHFAVNNQETDRLRVSANVDERALREIYLRAFQIAIEQSNAWTIMTSYNRINGTYASENSWLLKTVLRDEWGYDGVVVSDWGAVHDPVGSLKVGLDLRMPGRPGDERVRRAFAQDKLDIGVITETARRMQLLAERTAPQDASAEPDYHKHHALVREVAAKSSVLLTNDGALPVSISPGLRVAVIGELARKPRYQGAGSSRVNAIKVTNGLEALAARVEMAGGSLEFSRGYALDKVAQSTTLIEDAVAAAKRSDVTILFLGLPDSYEAEGSDRNSIELPANQLELLKALQAAAPKTIVAMSNGSAVTTASWRHSVNAIVEFWLTGQAHGEAIADILFGDVNPSGKLSETIPLRLEDTPAYLNFPGEHQNVTYGEGIYVGYRSYDARRQDVDHPFGHGLSYTTFDYSALEIDVRPLSDEIAVTARLLIRNTGTRRGAEVVQLYVHDHDDIVITPPIELRGWHKIELDPGATETVEIAVPRSRLEHWSSSLNAWIFGGGTVTIHVGSSSRDLRLSETVSLPGDPVTAPLTTWSTFGEWLDHPVAGQRLRSLFDARGGLKGRISDLLSDEVGKNSVRASPMVSIAEFPGVPIQPEDLEAICIEARTV
ncbi:glycoside hydrolase family 3 C-terminal domain-containing protein [Neorhizobium sp. NCHU2750]|uniref:beta-glucosidase family protein n=1 Tax=Neorhizobium sp. NCHU2750 TaxID=1825976 RepID=UPI000E74FB33|nr:beta-glucosidase [Neorhizobium sp. NCHU2750]